MRKTELLIPAGSLDVLKTAVIYGADAVYIGGEAFGLRAKAHNFSKEEMKEGIAFAHTRVVKAVSYTHLALGSFLIAQKGRDISGSQGLQEI